MSAEAKEGAGVKVLEVNTGKVAGWLIECPACKMGHLFDSGWTFNGDRERPTFSPSMLVRFRGRREKPDGGWEFDDTDTVCHSFVRDGKIEFLADCTHPLAGQTIELPEC